MGAIATGFQVLNTLMKVIFVVDTVSDVKKTLEGEELETGQKVHRVATGVLFIVAQGADCVCQVRTMAGKPPPLNIQLGAKFAAGGTQVLHQVSKMACSEPMKKEDWVQLLSLTAFRISDCAEFAIIQSPESFNRAFFNGKVQMTPECALVLNEIFKLLTSAVIQRDTIKKAPETVRSLGKKLTVIWQKCTNTRVPAAQEANVAVAAINIYDEILNANSIEDLDHIPEVFYTESVFRHYTCSETQNLIRFVRVVKGTEDRKNPIFYEKGVIEEKLENGERPASWPDSLPFAPENIAPYPFVQGQIDNQLRKSVRAIQQMERQGIGYIPPQH